MAVVVFYECNSAGCGGTVTSGQHGEETCHKCDTTHSWPCQCMNNQKPCENCAKHVFGS